MTFLESGEIIPCAREAIKNVQIFDLRFNLFSF